MILHISDTHGMANEIPESRFEGVDVVIHSGDCSNYMNPVMNSVEVAKFIEWYKNVPVKHKIYVAGNHDTSIERRLITPADFAEAGIIYLENSATTINGIKFWGSPYTPRFREWAFMKSRETINRVWDTIPEDTDILIIHGPPKGVRDLAYDGDHQLEFCGDGALLKAVRKLQPKFMCFGHIHNNNDCENVGTCSISGLHTTFSNAACVTDGQFSRGLTSFGNLIKVNIA